MCILLTDVQMCVKIVNDMSIYCHSELSDGITTFTVEVANFCAAMDKMIDHDDILYCMR